MLLYNRFKMSTTLLATIDAQLAKTPWQNLDVLASYLAEHPELLELPPPKLAEHLSIPENHAAVLLSSPEAYERIVSAVLQRTISPHKHAEIIKAIAEEATNPDQPLGPRIMAAKFVAQQTGVLKATKTAHQEEKVFRVLMEYRPDDKEVRDVFDSSTRLVNPELPPAEEVPNSGGGQDVVDTDYVPASE